MMILTFLAILYATVALGLYFKMKLYNFTDSCEFMALLAPLYWFLLLLRNCAHIYQASSRRVLLITLKHPYMTIFLISISLVHDAIMRPPSKVNKGNKSVGFAQHLGLDNANEMFLNNVVY